MVQIESISVMLQFLQQEYKSYTEKKEQDEMREGLCHGFSMLKVYCHIVGKKPNPENKKRDDSAWLASMKALLEKWDKAAKKLANKQPVQKEEIVTDEEKKELSKFIDKILGIQYIRKLLGFVTHARFSQLMVDTQNRQFGIANAYYAVVKNATEKEATARHLKTLAESIFNKNVQGSGSYWVDFGVHSCSIVRDEDVDGRFYYEYDDPNRPPKQVDDPDKLAELLLETAKDKEIECNMVGVYEINTMECIKNHPPQSDFFGDKKAFVVQLFCQAIANNDVTTVEDLLNDPSIPVVSYLNSPNEKQLTPLYVAALYGHSNMVKRLLEVGADVNLPSGKRKSTPLMAAILNGDPAVVKVLLTDKRLQLDVTNKRGATALHYAIIQGNAEVVKRLLKKGANSTAVYCGQTPLQLAMKYSHTDVACELIKQGTDISKTSLTKDLAEQLLAAAIKNANYRAVVGKLVKERPDIAKNKIFDGGETYVYLAAEYGRVTNLQTLLNHHFPGINMPIKTGETPLFIAVKNGHVSIIDELLKRKDDINLDITVAGETPLSLAVSKGDFDIAGKLLLAGASVKKLPQNARDIWLQTAAPEGDVKTVQLLLTNNAAGIQNPEQLLKQAVEHDQFNTARLLLMCHVNASELNLTKIQAWFELAVMANDYYVVTQLANQGIDIIKEASDKDLLTRLIKVGQFDMARFLLEGAPESSAQRKPFNRSVVTDCLKNLKVEVVELWLREAARCEDTDLVNILSSHPDLPNFKLYEAASKGQMAVVLQILSQPDKVDINYSQAGVTALMTALKNQHYDVARELFLAGANTNQLDEEQIVVWLVYAVRNKDKIMISPLLQWPNVSTHNEHLNAKMLQAVGKIISRKDFLDISNLDVQKNLNWVLDQVLDQFKLHSQGEAGNQFKLHSQWRENRKVVLQAMLKGIKEANISGSDKIIYLKLMAAHPCFKENPPKDPLAGIYRAVVKDNSSVIKIKKAIFDLSSRNQVTAPVLAGYLGAGRSFSAAVVKQTPVSKDKKAKVKAGGK